MGNKSSKKGGSEKESPAAPPPAAGEQKQQGAAEENRDNVSSLPTLDVPAQHRRRNRRCSVSAEVDHDPNEKFEPRVVEKSEEARARILAAVRKSFLFAALDRDQLRTVVDAMDEKPVVPGDVLIHQGAPGDFFYIIDHGQYEVWKRLPGEDPKKVFAYDNEGSFGELALMYNAPRAATVKASSDGVVWAVDRATFRHIIVTAGAEQRRKYEEFIQRVPLFSKLTAEERTRIADCLVPESYEDGETVLKLGDPGDKFYIIESGKAVATQFAAGDREVVVGRMEEGMFFGERALITDEPRAANVKADGYLKLAAMDRAAFERLLGDCRDIMGRHIEKYQSAEQLVEAGTAEEASPADAVGPEEPKEEAAAAEAAAEEPKEEEAAAEEPAAEEKAVAEEPATEAPKEEAAAEEPAAEEPAAEEAAAEEPAAEEAAAEEAKEEPAAEEAAEEPKEEPAAEEAAEEPAAEEPAAEESAAEEPKEEPAAEEAAEEAAAEEPAAEEAAAEEPAAEEPAAEEAAAEEPKEEPAAEEAAEEPKEEPAAEEHKEEPKEEPAAEEPAAEEPAAEEPKEEPKEEAAE